MLLSVTLCMIWRPSQGTQLRMVLVVRSFFRNFEIKFLVFFHAMSDLVHNVEAMFHIP